ncbi:MAG: hypothetical protein HY360_16230 [Verrucomicrobia bacterium]|nr:hypothetical protein [Verrucomicrobiota bacterium]
MNAQNFDVCAADSAWLFKHADRCVQAVRREAKGFVYYTPGGSYSGLFTRDFEYVVEGMPELVGAETLKKIIQFILRHQRADGGIPTMVDVPSGHASYCTIGDATRFTD